MKFQFYTLALLAFATSSIFAQEEDVLCDTEDGGSSPRLTGCPTLTLDFSTLTAGDYITDQLAAEWGVIIKARAKNGKGYTPTNGSHNSNGGGARVFDTFSPGGAGGIGDRDLGSPNEDCPGGGPGVGAGGGPDSPYSNCVPQGNVLIIQEDNSATNNMAQPDDYGSGGYIEFIFTDPVFIKEAAFLDVDDSKPLKLQYDNPSLGEQWTGYTGENGLWVQENMSLAAVDRFRVVFSGSGSVAYLKYTTCPTGV